jgi:hypothetical protein
MAAPIFIDIGGAAEGAELARAIGRHGLSAGLVRSGARWQVEINSPLEDPRTFLAGVGLALAAWNGGGRHGGAGRGSP